MPANHSVFVFRAVLAALLALLVCFAVTPAIAQTCVKGTQTQICGTETRITTNLADQFDPVISGNIIVYGDARGADLDIYYYDLSTGQEHAVTTAVGDQQLPNLYGPYAVYSDTTRRQVDLFNIQDGSTIVLGGFDAPATDPDVGDTIAVWEDKRYGANSQIMGYEIASGTVKRISNSSISDQLPAVSGRNVVWQRCDGVACGVWTYNWDTEVSQAITDQIPVGNPNISYSLSPKINGNRVAYFSPENDSQNMYVSDLATNSRLSVPADGLAEDHDISGDFVVFLYGESGKEHLKVWYLTTSEVFDLSVVSSTSSQFLTGIDVLPADGQNPAKGRVVYTDDRNGELDIYMFEFTWGPSAAPPVFDPMPSPVAEATSFAGATVTFSVTASNQDGPSTVTCVPASGGTFPLGATVDTCTAVDPKNPSLTSTAAFNVVVRDTTPPVLNLPGNVVANATSPAGAAVPYIVSTADLVDPNPVLACKPAPGSTIAIGDTAIGCTATDFSGNKSSGSFNVHVKGAPEQIADLEALVASYKLKSWVNSLLQADLKDAAKALSGKVCKDKACLLMDAFIVEVALLTGSEITQAQAQILVPAALQIKNVIGCH
ncbi:MAG TPA: HYR domain-containing protein [Terriglobales bacterium]|nr:HYR domain-containing protein [Terriglobales bacterium]